MNKVLLCWNVPEGIGADSWAHWGCKPTQPELGAGGSDVWRWAQHLQLPVVFGEKKITHTKKKLLQVHMTLETPWHPDLAGAYTEAMVGGPHEVSSRGGAEARTVAPQHPRTFQSYKVLRSRHKTPWMWYALASLISKVKFRVHFFILGPWVGGDKTKVLRD